MSARGLPFPLLLLLAGCTGGPSSDADLATRLGQALARACPDGAEASDEQARADCAAALTDVEVLRDFAADPFLWGGQTEDGVWTLADHTTRFHPLVFRRLYLSLYTFPSDFRVEALGDGRTLLHVAAHFRNRLDMGAYPYPFWHKQAKWDSYQEAQELVFVISHKQVLGALRSLAVDPSHQLVEHEWGGQWTWKRGDQLYPYAALYTFMFSRDNPHLLEVNQAFHALDEALRSESCLVCHSPENASAQANLELFNFPNQAITGRHRIVQQLQFDAMPIADPVRGYPLGLSDEAKRRALLSLAQRFAQAGDDALAWEGER